MSQWDVRIIFEFELHILPGQLLFCQCWILELCIVSNLLDVGSEVVIMFV